MAGMPSRAGSRSVRGALAPVGHAVGLFVVAAGITLGAWELTSLSGVVKTYVLPAPLTVFRALGANRALIAHQAGATVSASLIGLVVGTAIGVGAAILLTYAPVAHRAVFPLVIALSTAPLIAVIPVLVVALGNGSAPRIAIAAVAATLTTIIYVVRGVADTDSEAEDLLRSLDATAWQRLRIVQIYATMPYLFAAVRVSVSTCVIQTIVAEWISGTSGLGYLVQIAGSSNRSELMWAAVLVAVVVTLVLLGVLSIVEAAVMPWTRSSGRERR